MAKNVIWTSSCVEKLAITMFEMLAIDPLVNLELINDITIHKVKRQNQLFRDAQSIVFADTPESIKSYSCSFRTQPAVATQLLKLIAMTNVTMEVDPEPISTQAESNVSDNTLKLDVEQFDPIHANVTINSSDVSQLVTAIASKVAESIQDKVVSRVSDLVSEEIKKSLRGLCNAVTATEYQTSEIMESIREEKIPMTTKKVRVFIIGPMKQQQNILSSNWGSKFDLRFLDQTGGNIPHVDADRVIGMTNFMNHSTDTNLKNHYKDRYIRVCGGIRYIQKTLNDIYARVQH